MSVININYAYNDIKEALTTALRLIHGDHYEFCELPKSFCGSWIRIFLIYYDCQKDVL